MKKDTPLEIESCTRMLTHGIAMGIVNARAHTGPQAAQHEVRAERTKQRALPDMFEPVTSRNVPRGPTVTSLSTRSTGLISGCPSDFASTRSALS
jgi:hypothetical protein